MDVKIINISLPSELIKHVDAQAKLNYASRSEYIKRALIARLKSEGVLLDSTMPAYQTFEESRKARLTAFYTSFDFDSLEEDVD
jgi:metal-responsive CopG/Arc/MetJ family transcriptional regulator